MAHFESIHPPIALTPKEKVVLEFLETYVRLNGYAPTYQEICSHFGFASFNSAQRYLKQLESKSYISLAGGNQKRAIGLLQASSSYQDQIEQRERDSLESSGGSAAEALYLPLLGRVAAGAPIEAYEHDEFIDVPASLVKNPDRTYALRVQGQSMIDDGILDGDVILVQRQSRAENGEIVVAVVPSERGPEEATVKRFYWHTASDGASEKAAAPAPKKLSAVKTATQNSAKKKIELRPANSTMTSFWYDPSEVQIRGIVVGLIRRF